MKVWLVRTRTLVSWAELEKVLPRHLENEAVLARSGDLVIAGPLPTADGTLDGDGLTLYHAASADAARSLAETDPFVREHIRSIVSIELWDVRCVGRRAGELAGEAPGRTA